MPSLHSGFPTNVGVALVRGAPGNTKIKVPGIEPDATLIEIRQVSGDLVTNAEISSGHYSIPGQDHIELVLHTDGVTAPPDTSGNFLLVAWKEKL